MASASKNFTIQNKPARYSSETVNIDSSQFQRYLEYFELKKATLQTSTGRFVMNLAP
jgi:hypothetical protein